MSRVATQLDQRDIEQAIAEHFRAEGNEVRYVYFGLGDPDDPRPLEPEAQLTATVVFK